MVTQTWIGKVGFSPHARGSTSMGILFCHHRIIYPACAGVNLAVARCQKVYFYFPRMRGGQPRTRSPFEGDIGFSYPAVIGEYGANRKDAPLFGGNQEKHNESIMAWYGAVTAEIMKAGLIPYVWDINVPVSYTHLII